MKPVLSINVDPGGQDWFVIFLTVIGYFSIRKRMIRIQDFAIVAESRDPSPLYHRGLIVRTP